MDRVCGFRKHNAFRKLCAEEFFGYFLGAAWQDICFVHKFHYYRGITEQFFFTHLWSFRHRRHHLSIVAIYIGCLRLTSDWLVLAQLNLISIDLVEKKIMFIKCNI